jgi:hypothetical protein
MDQSSFAERALINKWSVMRAGLCQATRSRPNPQKNLAIDFRWEQSRL